MEKNIGARETLIEIRLSNSLADELVLPNTNTGSLDDTFKRWNFGFPLKAVISIKGPDVRWSGNEAGHTRTSEWSVIAYWKLH